MSFSNMELLRRDIVAARATLDALGALTHSVFNGVAHWFSNVEVERVHPLPVLVVSDEERTSLLGAVIDDLLTAIDAVAVKNLDDDEAFEVLAPVVDSLWREFYGLHAPLLNEAWAASLPTSDEERQNRVMRLEQMTGMDRQEIVARALVDRQMLATISIFGLTLDDFDTSD